MRISKSLFSLMLCAALAANPELVFAAGGIGSNVNSLFQTILDNMTSVGAVIASIAIVWAGFKIMFLGVSLRELGGPLIGAIVVGGAVWIAGLILG